MLYMYPYKHRCSVRQKGCAHTNRNTCTYPFDLIIIYTLLLYPSLKIQQVVDCGALDALVICLEEFDPGVKESSAWAIGYIARHNTGR